MGIIVAALLHLLSSESLCAPVDDATLTRQVSAAFAAERATGVDAYLLLGIAYVESCYQSQQVSYAVNCVGTGKARKCDRAHASHPTHKPDGAQASFYCGATQVGGNISWDRCVELMRNVEANYLFAANHLKGWMDDPHCAKRSPEDQLKCALLGNGGGYPAINAWTQTKGTIRGYPGRCLRRAQHLRRFVQTAPKT